MAASAFTLSSALGNIRDDVAAELCLAGEALVDVPKRARVLLVAGPNSGGKSLLLRYLASAARDADIQPLTVSMSHRTAPGLGRMVYGQGEGLFGTGASSVIAVRAVLKTATRVDEWTRDCALFLDEPDIGLSDEYALSMGDEIVHSFSEAPPHLKTLVIASHNRGLLRAATAACKSRGISFGSLVVGVESPTTLEQWLSRMPLPLPLDDLQNMNLERFRRISGMLDQKKQTAARGKLR